METTTLTEPERPTVADDRRDPRAAGGAFDSEPVAMPVPRLLGRLTGGTRRGTERRPTLIAVGGLHGNEPAGILAVMRVLDELQADPSGLRGQIVGLAGNRKALAARRRYLAADLNRHWLPDRVARLREETGPLAGEDEELRELEREIAGVLADTSGRVVLLDLHTTSGEGAVFVTLDDTLRNRALALSLPVPLVLGLEEELVGTLTGYANTLGLVALGFESGQHDDPESIDSAEAAVWVVLEATGVLKRGRYPQVAAARARLAAIGGRFPHVVELRYRHPVSAADRFRMLPGFRNFDRVEKGQPLAEDAAGVVAAKESSILLMPLYQKQGDDGFFLVRAVPFFWLKLSAAVRRLHLERFLHWLPGVERHPELPGTFVVDRRTARVLALELFHLLGFSRRGHADRYLVMTRRLDRRPAPWFESRG